MKFIGLEGFIKYQPVKNGRTLVIGSKVYPGKEDRRGIYENAIGLDLFEGDGVDIVHDLEEPLDIGKFDHIDCCSVLEHVKRPWKMCENIESIMNPGATIILQVPFVWRIHNYPGDYWRMTRTTLKILFEKVRWLERGYLADDVYYKKVPSKMIGGRTYIQRSELTAFGYLFS